MQIISRHDAHAAGQNKFYTGRPCKRGHLAQRYVGNGACVECLNFRLMPTLAARNVGMPPSPYAFPPDVPVTPGLLSYVHARVLRDYLHVLAREYLTLRAGLTLPAEAAGSKEGAAVLQAFDKLRTLIPVPADRDLDAYRAAGWAEDQLLAAGYARWQQPEL
jgi:hypothetical protein